MISVDLILTNANVLTMDNNKPRAGSVAVTNGRISGIWTESEPPRQAVSYTSKTKVINLDGATLIPGFIDTHNHLLMYAEQRKQVNCSTPLNQNITDIQARLREASQETPKDEWIIGYGYDDTLLDEMRHPTRADLDAILPSHPVFIKHISGHLAVTNSAGLNLSGIDDSISDPPGGLFGRNEDGKLNGVLYEPAAMQMVTSKIPTPSIHELAALIGEATKDYLAQGITMNTDAAIGLVKGSEDYEAHLKALELGLNPMRMQFMMMHTLLGEGQLFDGYSAAELDEEIRNRSHGKARLDSAKLFQDGSIQGLTGALRQAYHCNENEYGVLVHEQGAFNKEILNLHNRGYRITIHGNGDRAIGSILDAYEFALDHFPRKNHRHRIEHVQTATLEDLDRMKSLHIAASFFINHVYFWGDRHQQIFLGPERAKRIDPLMDAVDRDLLFTLHSDCPITPISPLFSIWAAVNRLTREGQVLGPEQRIDVETALRAMTIYGAILNFDEQNTGSIEVGKCADFAILSEDPTTINPLEIKDISVTATIIGGRFAYLKDLSLLSL